MVYFGVEDECKAHRLYDPKTKKIIVSRDVIFEEVVAWDWETEFGENSEFIEEGSMEIAGQPFTGAVGNDLNHQDVWEAENSGGADGDGFTGEVDQTIQQGTDANSGTVDGHTTSSEIAPAQSSEIGPIQNVNMDQDNENMGDSDNYDEPPLRFRNLNEVYEDSVEVEM
jgi:hypothetical protein